MLRSPKHQPPPTHTMTNALIHLHLAWGLAKRDFSARFRGSILGAFWMIINPLFTLAIYYYVFSLIFKARWQVLLPSGEDVEAPSALVLFMGLICFNFFSECFTRAPGLIRENPSYVKKIVFPLEIMPLVSVTSAFFAAMINVCLLLLFFIFSVGLPSWQALLLPITFMPLITVCLGLVYCLAALGVYLPDLKSLVGPIAMSLMFLTPIMYPISVVPESMRGYVLLNPLTHIVEQTRCVFFAQTLPLWPQWLLLMGGSMLFLALSFWLFRKLRKGFGDVL